jgi:hypothetical protein
MLYVALIPLSGSKRRLISYREKCSLFPKPTKPTIGKIYLSGEGPNHWLKTFGVRVPLPNRSVEFLFCI